MIHPVGEKNNIAQLTANLYKTADGASLPLHQWLPKAGDTKAVLVALHGFNDYGQFFDQPGKYLIRQGIACFAYDQRGFGGAPKRGLWAGVSTYIDDLRGMVQLLKQRYPHQPIYLLGESMGGAVIITALSQIPMPGIEGIILVAPALWARQTMPWYQTSLLWTLAHTFPWLTLTGKGIRVQASDNIEMLRALGKDPMVIKKTRVEAIYGLTNLMDAAFSNAGQLHGNTLILYGENDEIIPKKPTYDFLQRFLSVAGDKKTVAFYQQGYHMLLRDLNASIIWKDIVSWMRHDTAKLPSGADLRASEILTPIS
ncbi:alpha/beta hydrolase fold protein [Methyloglobulus morosus KoM1]|uniref:Alpha/beta hydrolase fold protein n=1 Tax=Methyloglobulus morosus KoM1 TaxID=1116472 RepID=V5E378_9GAMM|nr:alpha/beta hydrolase [Methyloglobulus morosus]ESS74016.1 alpha/beta hydrolase fold protein [Methyloglobulus morosus KoM1]